jgi:hypothetical protein
MIGNVPKIVNASPDGAERTLLAKNYALQNLLMVPIAREMKIIARERERRN